VQNSKKYLVENKKIGQKVVLNVYKRGKGGRIFEISANMGKHSRNYGNGRFVYRLDWMDYVGVPKVRPHYHLAWETGDKESTHHYFY